MIKNKKLREILASPLILVLSIIFSIVIFFNFIIHILGLVSYASPIGIIGMIFGTAISSVLCIGLWFVWAKGRKGIVSRAGIVCIQVHSIIKTVILSTLYLLIAAGIIIGTVVGSEWASFLRDDGESALIIIFGILFTILIIACITFTIIACVRIFGNLNIVKRNQEYSGRIKTGSIIFIFVVSIVLNIIIVVANISTLFFANDFVMELLKEIDIPIYGKNIIAFYSNMGIILPLGGSAIFYIACITQLIVNFAMIAVWVMGIILFCKIKKAYVESNDEDGLYSDEIVDIHHLKSNDSLEGTEVLTGGSITCICGMDTNITFPIQDNEEIIIGKDPRFSSIILEPKYRQVSRKHCGIKYSSFNNMYLIVDYSSNGTYILGQQKLTKGIYANANRGSIVCLANDDVQFRLD